ncbi:branched-chain amino acid ABC transporter permease [Streptomyces solisilvae]|uniref:branched-chain amino acid ABC transporter permease n=1 Tax=Streptomyces malaysiensis TaxID=92644 RepID=UPI0036A8B97B
MSPQELMSASRSRKQTQPEPRPRRAGAAALGLLEPVVVWVVVGIAGAALLHGSLLFLATTAVVYALFAMGTNVLLGWVGMTSFGQAAFFGVGAYATGLLTTHIESPVLVLIIGAVSAAVVALLFGAVATRTIGVEFAMLTLVFGQILWLLLYRVPVLGGESGLPGIPRGEILGTSLFLDDVFWWYAIVTLIIATVTMRRLRESTWGVGLTAVRDNPRRAAALGINVRWARSMAFATAGFLAGLAGALFAQLQGTASPDVMSWTLSGEVIIMCLLGGVHSLWGPVVGAAIFTYANHLLDEATNSSQLWFGLILLAVVLALPEGLAGLATPVRQRLSKRLRRGPRRSEEVAV